MLTVLGSLVVVTLATTEASDVLSANEQEALDRALAAKTVDELLACGEAVAAARMGRGPPSCGWESWPVARELATRNVDEQLIHAFGTSSPEKRTVIVYALYLGGRPVAAPFMNALAFGSRAAAHEEDLVQWAKAFLFKRCDRRVLREYSRRPYGNHSPWSDFEYSFEVEYFASCRYDPAIPYLLAMLEAFSGNLAGAAETSLRTFYPNDESLQTLDEVKKYYRARYKANPKP
jgi:hypothetical protein